MGYYVNLTAKQNCVNQINQLWQQSFPGEPELVWHRSRIEQELALIQTGESMPHLRGYVKTVNAWNKAFPICAEFRGQIFIGSIWLKDMDEEKAGRLRAQIKWVMDNRFLFEEITGLQDAVDALEMDIDADAMVNGRPVKDERINFDELPSQPKSFIYQRCLTTGRPDLWDAYLKFKESPTWDNWDSLRHKVIPGTSDTVWQVCERIATQRDNYDPGLCGRYKDGIIPPLFDIEKAIRESDAA